MEKLHSLSKLLPLGGAIIIILSSIKQMIYFFMFKINITDFLEVQEYISLFVDDLFIYSISFGMGIALYLRNKFRVSDIIPVNTVRNTDNGKSLKKLKSMLWLVVIICWIFIAFVMTMKLMRYNPLSFLEGLRLILMPALMSFFLIALIKKWNFTYLFFIFLMLMGSLIIDPFRDAYKVYQGKEIYKYQIVLNDEKRDLRDQRYIGKTENYLFLYDKIDGSTLVIRNEDIREIKVSTNR